MNYLSPRRAGTQDSPRAKYRAEDPTSLGGRSRTSRGKTVHVLSEPGTVFGPGGGAYNWISSGLMFRSVNSLGCLCNYETLKSITGCMRALASKPRVGSGAAMFGTRRLFILIIPFPMTIPRDTARIWPSRRASPGIIRGRFSTEHQKNDINSDHLPVCPHLVWSLWLFLTIDAMRALLFISITFAVARMLMQADPARPGHHRSFGIQLVSLVPLELLFQ